MLVINSFVINRFRLNNQERVDIIDSATLDGASEYFSNSIE